MTSPDLLIRLGTHAEKEYVEKTAKLLDGVVLGANLYEATPGATASLIVKLGGGERPVPVTIDPMTYAYGSYVDHDEVHHTDLAWIMSEQKLRKAEAAKLKMKTRIDVKRSYRGLAEALGGVFADAVTRRKCLQPDDFGDKETLKRTAKAVLDYQWSRSATELAKDPAFDIPELAPRPPAVLAPYFYIDRRSWREWTAVVLRLAKASVDGWKHPVPVHLFVCVDVEFLDNEEFLGTVLREAPRCGVRGVWLWFSRFAEEFETKQHLRRYRHFVVDLSKAGLAVYAAHGGFFSLALGCEGMRGVCHGVGYGEQKDVVPVIGQSTPTVRYYVPPLRRRLGVPDVQVHFKSLSVQTASDFFEKVCGCAVCKGVLGKKLAGFDEFGEQHYSRPDSMRMAQTPAAAKRCRFHFLLNRIAERDWIRGCDLAEVVRSLDDARRTWGTPAVVGGRHVAHLSRWSGELGCVPEEG